MVSEAPSFAIITPSHRGDYARCALLVESVQRFLTPAVPHYLIVDRHDRERFTDLAGPRTHLVEIESLLPTWLRQVPLWSRWWWSTRTLPVRGWILQQVAKLAMAEHVREEVLVFVDSDVAFVRPFHLSSLVRGRQVRLYASKDPRNTTLERRGLRIAAKVLGTAPCRSLADDYVGNVITWRRDHARQLLARMEQIGGRPWIEALCRHLHFSEYLLYGVFVQQVLGAEAGHYTDGTRLCQEWWDPRPMSDAELGTFFAAIEPHHVAVMISAKASMPPSRYRAHLAAIAAGEGGTP